MSYPYSWQISENRVRIYQAILLSTLILFAYWILLFMMIGNDIDNCGYSYYDSYCERGVEDTVRNITMLVLAGSIALVVFAYNERNKLSQQSLTPELKLRKDKMDLYYYIAISLIVFYALGIMLLNFFQSIDGSSIFWNPFLITIGLFWWVVILLPIFGLLFLLTKNAPRADKHSIIYSLIFNSGIYNIPQLEQMTLITQNEIFGIMNSYLLRGILRGRIENNQFVPSPYPQTNQMQQPYPHPGQPSPSYPIQNQPQQHHVSQNPQGQQIYPGSPQQQFPQQPTQPPQSSQPEYQEPSSKTKHPSTLETKDDEEQPVDHKIKDDEESS